MNAFSDCRYTIPLLRIMTLLCTTLFALPATGQSADYGGMRDQFRERIPAAAQNLESSIISGPQLPETFSPWWQDDLTRSVAPNQNAMSITLDDLLLRTLDHSAQVKVFSDLPLIRETAVTEACAEFDWRLFLDTRWDDISDPVGNILTTGGSPRYRDHVWTGSAGVSRKNMVGGSFETSQRIGHQNNNSNFFLPNNQGTTQWSINYTQPLLRGAGEVYNKSLIVLARIDASVAGDEFQRQLQSHLLEVARAYWTLYLERGSLLQKRRLLQRAEAIESELSARARVDTVHSQLIRIQAAVTQRRSELVRTEMAIQNSQDRLNALVNDPALTLAEHLELVPADVPSRAYTQLDVANTLSTALDQRPEINQSLRQIRAASVRLGMSRNELLPQLDAVLETYVSGLRGGSDIGNAWVDQFRAGEPSYGAGLVYQLPIGRRAARARLQRRQLEMRQLQNQFRATVETLLLEVQVAIREVETGYSDMVAKYHAMRASAEEVDYIEQRWRRLAGEERSINLYLEDLLQAQQRLAEAEFAFLQAETTHGLSLINLKRADGTLLQYEGIVVGRGCVNGLPTQILDKDRLITDTVDQQNWPDVDVVPVSEELPEGESAPVSEAVPVSQVSHRGQQVFSMIESVDIAQGAPASQKVDR